MITTTFVDARSNMVSNAACINMTPVHGDFVPQNSTAKVQIVPHAIKMKRGNEIKISLQTTSKTSVFRGFLIQARKVDTNEIIGTFRGRNYNIVSCGGFPSTASHQNPSTKSSQILFWKSPMNFQGSVRF